MNSNQESSRSSPFNGALEVGIRALIILNSFHPRRLRVSELALFDYFLIHSADAGGPPSIHPSIPSRHGEYFVRRGRIEAGLELMRKAHMVHYHSEVIGTTFEASDKASALVDTMATPYNLKLKDVADWLSNNVNESSIFQESLVKLVSGWNSEMGKDVG